MINREKVAKKKCAFQAGHEGECFCDNSKEEHKCNNLCSLYKKSNGCKIYCDLPLGHKSNHFCKILEDKHLCKGDCSLNGKIRGNCFNNGKCCLSYGHNGNCICSKNHQHLCNNFCDFFLKKVKKDCNRYCSLLYGHEGDYICNIPISLHLCPNNCYYFNKSKGNCNEFCNLPYGHKSKCICKEPNNHLCNNECSFFGKSGGCNRECSLKYEHEGECLCNANFHTCKEKCELCQDPMECGHVYNHNLFNNLICHKCNNSICKLSKNGHLCGGQHDCQELCEIEGWCEIESFIKQEEQTYTSESGEEIKYYTIKFQEIHKKKCIAKIPINEFSHQFHSCGVLIHKCGKKCKQCEYCCTDNYGHSGLHNCLHGNIKNSCFSVSNNIAMVRKENRSYKFIEGETAKIFFCDEYCREQGQGHTHLFNTEKEEKNENFKPFGKKDNEYIYECKCSYFWEHILGFKGNFISEEQKKFSLCNWKCKYESHQTPEYCQLSLWHDNVNEIPKGIYGTWVSQGHVFKCIHLIGIYSIFLVDQSGSMKSKSSEPTNPVIKEKMNNMIGASIQAIYDFCKKRDSLSPKDKSALIGFNDKADKIFENIPIGNNEILNYCLTKLNPKGGTYFVNAFKEAKTILEGIDRKEHTPIIILLTDGLDHGYKDTIEFLKNDVSIILFNSFIYS